MRMCWRCWLLIAGVVFAMSHVSLAAGPNPLTLHSFCALRSQGNCLDGSNSAGGDLVRGPKGSFYGITVVGGIQAEGHGEGGGEVYRIDGRTGRFSVLYQFDPLLDGYGPTSIQVGSDGNLYGTLAGSLYGLGCVFRLSPTGDFTLVHAFAPGEVSGPLFPLVEDPQGNWYGAAYGSSSDNGEIYKISPDGSFALVHQFGRSDAHPDARLLLAGDGNFYGTTSSPLDAGTIFRMTPDGSIKTMLDFDSISEGNSPGELTAGPDGALYGVTAYGATNAEGTIFRITLDGHFSVLHVFAEPGQPGPLGPSALTLMPDGNLYGVGMRGGDFDGGMIYRITSSGAYTRLYSFTKRKAGAFSPGSALVLGFDGASYGITDKGGRFNNGVAYRYLPSPSH